MKADEEGRKRRTESRDGRADWREKGKNKEIQSFRRDEEEVWANSNTDRGRRVGRQSKTLIEEE